MSEGEYKLKKEPVRFNFERDKFLLEEIRDLNPYSSSQPIQAWETISETINEKFDVNGTGRTYKNRASLLLQKHRKQETESLKRSGPEEDFTSFCSLLTDVSQLEVDARKAKIVSSKDGDRKVGLQIRAEAAKNRNTVLKPPLLVDDANSEYGKRKIEEGNDGCTDTKKGRNQMIDYLTEKNQQMNDLKKEELEIRRQEAENTRLQLLLQAEKDKNDAEERKASTDLFRALAKKFLEKM